MTNSDYRRRYAAIRSGVTPTAESKQAKAIELPEPEGIGDEVAPGIYQLDAKDGQRYSVECAYTVTIDGQAYTVPTAADARELIELAADTAREQAAQAASFKAGQTYRMGSVTLTVAKATASGVTVETEAMGCVKRQTLKVRNGERGQYVRLHANSKAERDIYAADMAA